MTKSELALQLITLDYDDGSYSNLLAKEGGHANPKMVLEEYLGHNFFDHTVASFIINRVLGVPLLDEEEFLELIKESSSADDFLEEYFRLGYEEQIEEIQETKEETTN